MIIPYATPQSARPQGRNPAWWLLMGPGTGIVVGLAQALSMTVAVACTGGWPQFFHGHTRGLDFLEYASFGCSVCGAGVGFGYGLILLTFESITHRRVAAVRALAQVIVCMVVLTLIVGIATTMRMSFGESENLTLLAVLFPATLTVCYGLVCGFLGATRPTAGSAAQPNPEAALVEIPPTPVAKEEAS